MSDNLKVFGVDYTGVNGFKAKTPQGDTLTFVRPQGSISISQNGTTDVSQYASAVVNVSGGGTGEDWVVIVSNNLHDSSQDVTDTYIDRGTETTYSGWSSTDYIPVKANTWYLVKNTPGNNWNALYTSEKTLATDGRSFIVPNSTNSDSLAFIKTTSDAAYIRMSATTAQTTSFEIYEVSNQFPTGSIDITSNGTVNVSQYESAIVNVPTGSSINNQNKSVTPTESQQSITADSGYTGLGTVTVGAISSTYVGSGIARHSALTVSGKTVTAPAGYYETALSETVSVATQTKSATPSETAQTITPDTGYDGLSSVSVGAISSTYVGSGIARRTQSDIEVDDEIVSVPAGYYEELVFGNVGYAVIEDPVISVSNTGLITASTEVSDRGFTLEKTVSDTLQLTTKAAATITPTESEQTAVAANTYTTGIVKVGAISSTYVGSGITQRSGTDLTASGATVTVPAGYYDAQATKSVATTTHPNPTASINTSTGLITASHTQTAGYVSAGTTTGTTQLTTQAAKTVTPTESEQTAVAANVYTTGVVKVGAISSTYVGSGITRGSSSSVQVNSNNNTISVPVGYYDTAVNKSMAEASINTTTSGVTIDSSNVAHGSLIVSTGGYISAGTYTTTQGIQIQKYYTGSGNPSSSLGNNGDLYFKVVS